MKKAIRNLMLVLLFAISLCFAVDGQAAARKPYQVKGLTVKSVSYNKLKLTWKRPKNAKGYYIYRATSRSGKYKKIKTIKKATTKTYTDTKRAFNKTYYYKVRAYNGKKKGKLSAVKYAKTKLSTPKILDISNGGGINEIRSSMVSGANGYALYVSSSSKGTYKAVDFEEYNYLDNFDVKAGVARYYKVRAYRLVSGKKIYSSYSPVKMIKNTAGTPYDYDDSYEKNITVSAPHKLGSDLLFAATNNSDDLVSMQYKISAFSSTGALLATTYNGLYLRPHKETPFFITMYDANRKELKFSTCKIEYRAYPEILSSSDITDDVEISNIALTDDQVSFQFTNKASLSATYAEIVVTYINSNGQIVAVDNAYLPEEVDPNCSTLVALTNAKAKAAGFDPATGHVEVILTSANHYETE